MQTYELNPSERRQHQEIVDGIATHGGMYRMDRDGELQIDGTGAPTPLEYVVLRSRRFLVDARGVLWRYFAEGSAKNPSSRDGGGSPWRSNRVEMWTGRWRKTIDADGSVRYAKVLTARPLDKRINGHPGMSQIDWYRTRKKYRHPLEGPEQPADADGGQDNTRSTPNESGSQHGGTNGGAAHASAGTAGAADGGTAAAHSQTARTNRQQG